MTNRLKSIFIVALVIAAVAAIFWLAKNLGGGEGVESEKPRVVCKKGEECFWTAHIHANLKIIGPDGKEIIAGFEQGLLEGHHIHSQPGKIHWHGLIAVDPTTKEVKDWGALAVRRLPEHLQPKVGLGLMMVKFFINGQEADPDARWQDGDNIEIHFGQFQ